VGADGDKPSDIDVPERDASESGRGRSPATKYLLPSRSNRRSSSTTFISLYMFHRNFLPLRDIRFPRRPAASQSRHSLSRWLPPSSSGRGGRSGYIFRSPPAAMRGRCAPRTASCSPLSALPAPENFRSDSICETVSRSCTPFPRRPPVPDPSCQVPQF
jgi:hypothetical protein